MHEKRRKIWIDASQTKIMVRVALYLMLMQATVVCAALIADQFFTNVSQGLGPGFARLGLIFVAIVLVVPSALFIYDVLKTVHRIVGPVYRFRKTLQAIANGEEVSLVRLRKGDYLLEMQDDMNALIEVLAERGVIRLKTPTAASTTPQVQVTAAPPRETVPA